MRRLTFALLLLAFASLLSGCPVFTQGGAGAASGSGAAEAE